MDRKNIAELESKSGPGGLLGNVSLLTTGGSSLQQHTNSEFTSTRNQTLSTHLEDTERNGVLLQELARTKNENVNTSTPARPFMKHKNVVYGFDLSPVHSHELPSASATNTQNVIDDEPIDVHPQDKFEENLFVDSKSKAAPNFMQAPLVPSPHQSRISVRASDETETMMSQVYSSTSKAKTNKNRSGSSAKKSNKVNRTASKSPSYGSPRKTSSRLYSHVHGSGYGVVSPWKSSAKTNDKLKTKAAVFTPKKKAKSRKSSLTYTSNAAPSQLSAETKDSLGISLSPSKNFATGTYKVRKFEEIEYSGGRPFHSPGVKSPADDIPNVPALSDPQHKDLEERLKILEIECSKLKTEKAEADKEKLIRNYNKKKRRIKRSPNTRRSKKDFFPQISIKLLPKEKLKKGADEIKKFNSTLQRSFLLMAKLNNLKSDGETVNLIAKDSLNQDNKDAETSQLKREVLEQERLLKGYQQENEKFYTAMAKLKTAHRENETAMFNENLKLKNKVASLKEELDAKDAIIKDKNSLLLDSRNVRPRSTNRSVQTIEESFLDAMTKQTAAKVDDTADLKRKLAWFEETQIILEEKCKRLERDNRESDRLRKEVSQFNADFAAKKTSKDEQSTIITDLRRQVKELENIMSKSQTSDHLKDLLYGDNEKKLLEQRCKQLEDRLKEQEGKFSHNLSSLHELYKNMSSGYEERVENLSQQLEILKKHSRRSEELECAEEKRKFVFQENTHLKIEIENLKKELEERKALSKLENIKKSPTPKVKKRPRSSASNDAAYYPNHFIERISAEKDNVESAPTSELKRSFLEIQEKLTMEKAHWKKRFEESNALCDELKQKQDTDMKLLTENHKKTLNSFESAKTSLERKCADNQSRLSQYVLDLSSSQAREQALQLQVRNLLDELQETRLGSPNVALRHLESLQSQIRLLNYRQKTREDKLDKVVSATADEYLKAEIGSLHNMISEKNHLIAKFQYELDAILNVLESVQRNKLH